MSASLSLSLSLGRAPGMRCGGGQPPTYAGADSSSNVSAVAGGLPWAGR